MKRTHFGGSLLTLWGSLLTQVLKKRGPDLAVALTRVSRPCSWSSYLGLWGHFVEKCCPKLTDLLEIDF